MFKVETIKTFDELDSEKELMEFKSNRANGLNTAVIEISTGKKFDADDKSQSRMSNTLAALNAANKLDTDTLEWSLADTGSGVRTEITVAELKEALILAVENMAAIWLR